MVPTRIAVCVRKPFRGKMLKLWLLLTYFRVIWLYRLHRLGPSDWSGHAELPGYVAAFHELAMISSTKEKDHCYTSLEKVSTLYM